MKDFFTMNRIKEFADATPNVIWSKTNDAIRQFRKQPETLKQLGNCILITGASDCVVSDGIVDKIPDNIKHWFTVNANTNHPKVSAIPLGIRQTDEAKIRAAMSNERQDENLLYVCFTTKEGMGKELESKKFLRRFQTRSDLYLKFENKKWATVEGGSYRVPRTHFYNKVNSHHYVLSPHGIGPDCLRHWESIILGSIPIVFKSKGTDILDDLPCLRIDSADEITKDFLMENLDTIKKKFNHQSMEKLWFAYWEKEIKKAILEI